MASLPAAQVRESVQLTEKLDWQQLVTPKLLRSEPIHNWFVFPHSYSAQLIDNIASDWGISQRDLVLDPFCGAGTTLVALQSQGISSVGIDLSPFATFVSAVKTRRYARFLLQEDWKSLRSVLASGSRPAAASEKQYPDIIYEAFDRKTLDELSRVHDLILVSKKHKQAHKELFLLGLLSILSRFSRLVATGGWLKRVEPELEARDVEEVLIQKLDWLVKEASNRQLPRTGKVVVKCQDARLMNLGPDRPTYVITSPPYPNRHDYTRVFGIELQFHFVSWERLRGIRYQSIQSHPEAHPIREESTYAPPEALVAALESMKGRVEERRILPMLSGYFEDMFLVLSKLERVCCKAARIGFVVGNVRYGGIHIPVDEILLEVARQAGLQPKEIIALRYRGNSAQQMKLYGRNAARESLVVMAT